MGLLDFSSLLNVWTPWNSHRVGARTCLIQERGGYLPLCDVPRHTLFPAPESYVTALGLASSQVNEYGVPLKEDFIVAVGTTFEVPAVSLLHFPSEDNFTRSWSQRDYDTGRPPLTLGTSDTALVLVVPSVAQVEDDGDGVWTRHDRVVNEYKLGHARFGNATLPTEKIRADVCTTDGVFCFSWELIDSAEPTNVVVGVKLTIRNLTLKRHPRRTYVGIRTFLAHTDVKLHEEVARRVVESHAREPMYWIWHKDAHWTGETDEKPNYWFASSHMTSHGHEFNALRYIEDAQVRAIAKASKATRVTEMTFLFLGEAPASGVIDEMTWSSTLTWFDKDPEARGPIGISAILLVFLIVIMSFVGAFTRRSRRRREPDMARSLIAPT